tara:strand:- start:1907 stop:2386 length:480 start_codon:yes stop_codon:yes gene_type:complete
MGLFSRKTVLGTMRVDFLSLEEVRVTHSLPPDLLRTFSFLHAAKLLSNFPGNTGKVMAGVGRLNLDCVDDSHPLDYNQDLMGICVQPAATIAEIVQVSDVQKKGGWSYFGQLCEKGEGLFVDTKICSGHEERFHGVAVEAGFETARRSFGERGGHCVLE